MLTEPDHSIVTRAAWTYMLFILQQSEHIYYMSGPHSTNLIISFKIRAMLLPVTYRMVTLVNSHHVQTVHPYQSCRGRT